jgi:plastocyanin
MNAKSALVSIATVGLLLGATGCSSSSDSDAQDTGESSVSDSPAGNSPKDAMSSPSMSMDSSKSTSSDSSQEQAAMITIEDFQFSDPDSVAPGTEIMVENLDSSAHTVTAEGDGGFDVTVNGDDTVTFTAPSKPGSYPYICNFHGDMTGTLVVK